MTQSGGASPVRALLLDVEGTTTPVSFVHDVLFRYARTHLAAYLNDRVGGAELREAVALLASEWDADRAHDDDVPSRRPAADDIVAMSDYLNWLMDRDRKSPGLKLVQGRVWESGYSSGALRGQVFPDVPAALARWTGAGLTIAIFSSGSALAQRLLFAHSDAGDLTPFIARYFDTSVGSKRSPASYATIAAALGSAPEQIAFLSDVNAELDAARAAGLRTLLAVRPGNAERASRLDPTVASFDDVDRALDTVRP